MALVYSPVSEGDPIFNAPALDGVKDYAAASGKTYKTYMPTGASDSQKLAAINAALSGGADTVICYGPDFTAILADPAGSNPNVKFIVIDEDLTPAVMNIAAVPFRSEQAGYIAGYAAVKEGYRNLGFIGSGSGSSVSLYGWGFVQGANAAATELKLPKDVAGAVNIKYSYAGIYALAADIKAKAGDWFRDSSEPTDLIFAAGGTLYESVAAAASEYNAANSPALKKIVIASDTDRSGASQDILTSAIKGVKPAIKYMLKIRYESDFPGGKVVTALGAAIDGAIGIPKDTWRFKNFDTTEYDNIIRDMKNNNIDVRSNKDFNPSKMSATDAPGINVRYRA
jgi:basic membrane protein A